MSLSAFLIAWLQQTLAQELLFSSLQPTHWIITRLSVSARLSSPSTNRSSSSELGQHPWIFPVEILGGFVLRGTRGENGGAMVDGLDPALGFHCGDEIPHIAGDVGDGRVMRDVDQRVLIDLSNEIFQVRLNVQPFEAL